MIKLKSDIELTADLLKLKAVMRNFQQTTYASKKMEDRFPEIEFATEEEMVTYIRRILALKYDIEDTLVEINKLYDKYGKAQ